MDLVRTLALALLVSSAGPALAGPVPPPTPVRKPVPAGMTAEVIKQFAQAIVYDKAGDVEEAARAYDKANEAAPFAATFYNLADVHRRMDKYRDAIQEYQKYLELAPDAPDKAEVARIIDQLKHADFTVVLQGKEPGAVVFLDGKLLGPSPQIVKLAPGSVHAFDRISPTGHRHGHYEAKYDQFARETLDDWSARPKKEGEPPGNVVLSASGEFGTSGSWVDKDTGIHFEFPGRQFLPPGHYSTFPWNDNRLCVPIAFDVPKLPPGSTDVLYVYVDAKAEPTHRTCQPATIRTQIVKVGPL